MAVFANIPPTSTQGPTQSTTISSGVTPTVDTESLAASVEAAPELKENLLITFVAKPDYLIDTTGEWWHDTTKYEDIHDHSAESISEDERHNFQRAIQTPYSSSDRSSTMDFQPRREPTAGNLKQKMALHR